MTGTRGSGDKVPTYPCFVDGRWRDDPRDIIKRCHPGTGQPVAHFVAGTAADVDDAVLAARRALGDPAWAGLSLRQRSALLTAAADAIAAEAKVLAEVESCETGKPVNDALSDILGGVELWRYAAAALRTMPGEYYPALSATTQGMTVLEPVGVVGLILPWNFPFIVSAERLPFILAAGCTVVAKPSEHAGGTAALLGPLLKRAGLPDGVYNVVSGLGPVVGQALVDHADVAMISFTGSSENGRQVMASAARTLKRVSLELGGKSPVVVFADADFDRAADAVIAGFTHNAGQCCIATTRLLLERGPAADRFKALLAERLNRRGTLQPVATQAQFDKVTGYIQRGAASETMLTGGPREGGGPGFFVTPTVFDHVAAESPICTDEIFGPVLAIQYFDGEDDAVQRANNTRYGLAAAVWSGDQARAMRVARRIRAGRLWINSAQENFPEMPVGGYGWSGIGREAGTSGIREYCEIKSIIMGS